MSVKLLVTPALPTIYPAERSPYTSSGELIKRLNKLRSRTSSDPEVSKLSERYQQLNKMPSYVSIAQICNRSEPDVLDEKKEAAEDQKLSVSKIKNIFSSFIKLIKSAFSAFIDFIVTPPQAGCGRAFCMGDAYENSDTYSTLSISRSSVSSFSSFGSETSTPGTHRSFFTDVVRD